MVNLPGVVASRCNSFRSTRREIAGPCQVHRAVVIGVDQRITVIVDVIVLHLDSTGVGGVVIVIAVPCVLRVAIAIIIEDVGPLVHIAVAVIVRAVDDLLQVIANWGSDC